MTVAWLVLLCCAIIPFNWGILICLLAPLVTLLINRINIKRLQAGKQPY